MTWAQTFLIIVAILAVGADLASQDLHTQYSILIGFFIGAFWTALFFGGSDK